MSEFLPRRRFRRAEGTDGTVWHAMGPFLRPQRRRLVLLALTSAIGGFAEAAVLVLIARVAFALATNESSLDLSVAGLTFEPSIASVIATAAALVLLRMVLQIAQAYYTAAAITGVLRRIRSTVSRQYLGANWALQSAAREGRLQELLTTYSGQAASAVMSLAQGTVAVFNLLALMVTAIFVNARAAFAVAMAGAVIAVCLRPFRTAVRRKSRLAADRNLDFATALTELAATTQEVRVFGVEKPVADRLDALNAAAATHLERTRFLMGFSIGVYQGVALGLIVLALAGAYWADVTGLGTLGAVVLLMIRALSYGQAAQTSAQTLHEAAPYFETLNTESARYAAAAVRTEGDPVGPIGCVSFENVSFEYASENPVLHDMSFEVQRGEIIGIVGPSGSGKSTLVQLLLRLRAPTEGRVLVDGRDVQLLDLDEWYRRVTFVPQDAHLFAGTVTENIAFFRPGIEFDAVERAARRARVHNEILSWPLGYDTPVGERGSEISGGQRQRICIARALVTDPDLLVFDEPTSALDAQSEALMRDTMVELAPQATVFVIAHRLSTVSVCDRIVVVREGRIQGFDAPRKLEESDPFYREALRLSGMR